MWNIAIYTQNGDHKYLPSFSLNSGKKLEKPSFAVNELLNEKVSLWQGDITSLEIDAIVNAGKVCLFNNDFVRTEISWMHG